MEFYIGRSKSWDACTYPRVSQWPLTAKEEVILLAKYASLLIAAYMTYEGWKQRSRNLDGYFVRVELTATELPEKVYVVLGAHPEKITWSGEWAPYRLRIDVVWWHNSHPAFTSREEAQRCADECLISDTNSRFTVVELTVVK